MDREQMVLDMSVIVILGLDPSPLRLGWGTVDLDTGTPIACGTQPLGKWDDGWLDASSVRGALRDIGTTFVEPSVVYIEAGYIGPNPTIAIRIAEAMGQTVQAVNRRWPDAIIQRVSPQNWRIANGLKGNAPKAECFARAIELGFQALDQDAADGALIATAGWHSNQEILDAQGAVA